MKEISKYLCTTSSNSIRKKGNMNLSTLTIGVVVALSTMALTAGTASAYRGDPNVQGPNYTLERHQAMTQAFENNDYQAWKDLMVGKGRVLQVVNESNFSRFAEMHRLMMAGDVAGAQKIRAELGLGMHYGMSRGQGFGNRGQGCTMMNR